MKGTKHDQGKLRYDLIPPKALKTVASVLTFGSSKYSDNNWKRVKNCKKRYMAAALRHIEAHRLGEHLDPETKEPHLSHAICCLMFLVELYKHKGDKRAS